MLESGLLQQLRGWVHQTGLQMDQLTTIFAAPASDENGVNCVVKYSWRDNYLGDNVFQILCKQALFPNQLVTR